MERFAGEALRPPPVPPTRYSLAASLLPLLPLLFILLLRMSVRW